MITVDSTATINNSLLAWADQFEFVSVLRSNSNGDYTYPGGIEYNQLVAIDAIDVLICSAGNAFQKLEEFKTKHQNKWIFGHFGYDLKQETEHVFSKHEEKIGFSDLCFFVPKHVLLEKKGGWTYSGQESLEFILNEIKGCSSPCNKTSLELYPIISKEEYISSVEKMQTHIQRGDIYEANFCQTFQGTSSELDPINTFEALMKVAPTPFAAFYKNKKSYLLSASPERYIKKKGEKLISQPIKGTAKRGNSPKEDLEIATALKNDPKERAENVMIVDLVRNDLSHYAQKNSVEVSELFGTYQFPQVHQLISTVECKIKDEKNFTSAIKASFPMGSMTGAPKKRAMEIIEDLESFRRGLYSGSVGYFSPDGNADFNVVIRSILYNQETGYTMCPVGGAITINANPEQEYKESILKAEAIIQLLKG